jgi:hypothetical protein
MPITLSAGAVMSHDKPSLNRLTPFDVRIVVDFMPEMELSGYRLAVKSLAVIGDKRVAICVSPQMRFTNAQPLTSLRFDLSVDASAIVPHVNKANQE